MQTKPIAVAPVHNPDQLITSKAHVWINQFFLMVPNLLAALVFLFVAYWVARLLSSLVGKLFHRRGRQDLGSIIRSIVFGALIVLAILVAAAIIFPSVKPGDILSTLGIGSVAVGFAFKDILQNLFAGVLLLINRPFRRGDQIVVKDYEGTVEHIESRATLIKTYDGRRVIIPNADIYTSPVTVNTAYEVRRDQFDIGIGYGDKPAHAAELIKAALANVEGVLADPAPEVLPWALGESDVQLRARWWTKSLRTDVVHTRSRVVLKIFETCVAEGIDLPFPTQMILLHDQTEDTDGDRTKQREGWPAGSNPPKPREAAAKPVRTRKAAPAKSAKARPAS